MDPKSFYMFGNHRPLLNATLQIDTQLTFFNYYTTQHWAATLLFYVLVPSSFFHIFSCSYSSNNEFFTSFLTMIVDPSKEHEGEKFWTSVLPVQICRAILAL
jgi:hypothetical protein